MEQPHTYIGLIFPLLLILFFIAIMLVRVLFAWSLYLTATRIPQQHRLFPSWFCWMTIIPFVGFVFEWLMVPFGIPWGLKKFLSGKTDAIKQINILFGIGLAYTICFSTFFIPVINIITGIGGLVLFIIYWVKVVGIRKEFLD